MTLPVPDLTAFRREVAGRFGLVPNFFVSAPDAPEIIERLWDFAKAAYLDSPIPPLFKERLFVYLSRFCEARYCIVRHCAFLVGYGHSSGDPAAPRQTVEQAIRLLKAPSPWQRDVEAVLAVLEAGPQADWPDPETDLEDRLFCAATMVFVEPGRAKRALHALRHVLGGRRFEHLLGLLAFIRTAHYWTVLHPELLFEEDVRELLASSDELARLLLEDPEAARCDMGVRLFSELQDLRGLHERRDLQQAKRALEVQVEQKENLLKEVNHRVKNSLQIVSSILELQLASIPSTPAADALRSAASRVMAIAAVHERLYTGSDVRVVSLDAFLGRLCEQIGRAVGAADGITTDIAPLDVPTDMAIPLAIIVNELVTNAIKHVGPPCRITLRCADTQDRLILMVADTGAGPSSSKPSTGMGSRLVQALVHQLGARVETRQRAEGYTVKVIVPLPKGTTDEGPNC
jgi:two-component sensor histidine kinase